MRSHWLLRYTLITAATIAAVFAAVLLGGPLLLDLPWVHEQVERKVSEAANGHITWDALQLRLLPSPHAVLRGVHLDLPGTAKVDLQRADASLRWSSLLQGRLEIASVTLAHGALELNLPAATGKQATATQAAAPADPISAYRAAVGPLVKIVRQFAPDSTWTIEIGRVAVQAAGFPQLELRDLTARARTGLKGFELDLAAASNFWSKLHLTARLEFADLSGHAELQVSEIKPQPWLDRLRADPRLGITLQSADVGIIARSDAKTSIQADVILGVPTLQIARKQRQLEIAGILAKATVVARVQDTQIDVTELRLGAVLPAASAALKIDADGQRPQVSVDIPALNLTALRDAALTLAGDEPAVAAYAPRIRAGEVTQLHFGTQADTWADLFTVQRIQATLTLTGGAVLLPRIEQLASSISARVEFADATLHVASAMAELGGSKVADGDVRYVLKDGSVTAGLAFDIQVPQAVALTRKLLAEVQRPARLPKTQPVPLRDLQSASGSVKGRARIASAQRNWNVTTEVDKSDAHFRVAQLPWPVALRSLRVSATPRQITITSLGGALGRSMVDAAAAQIALGSDPKVIGASGHLTLALDELYPWLRSQKSLAGTLRDLTTVSGIAAVTLHRLAGRIKRPAEMQYDLTIEPRQVGVRYEDLPAPVNVSGGAIRIDARTLKIDRLGVSLLDARTTLSATIDEYRGRQMQVIASAADGSLGPQITQWAWTRTGAPPRFEPRTPIQFAAPRVSWGPGRKLDAQMTAQFDGGQRLAAELFWKPDALDVRRLVIKDRLSNATLALALKDRLLQTGFSGMLDIRSVAALFKQPGEYSGSVDGDLRFDLDLQHVGRTRAEGKLSGRAVDLNWLLAKPVTVDRIELDADGTTLHVREAVVNWAQQLFKISGEAKRTNRGAIVNAKIDSPGVLVNALLPPAGAAPAEPPAKAQQSETGQASELLTRLWPLPVTGKIELHSDFIQHGNFRVQPVSATVLLEDERARIDLHEAKLCGISFPLTVIAVPQGVTASAHLVAQGQQLEATSRCLSGQNVLITGAFDARADLTTSGKLSEFQRNLKGTMHFRSHDGRIRKMSLVANILAVLSVTDLFEKGGPQLDSSGFTYRTIVADAHFDAGKVFIDEGALDSNALGLAVTGSISLEDRQTDLTILVAPFSRIDRLVRAIPIVGYLLGGVLTTVPVRASGDIYDPLIVPLSPTAITSELTGIFTRTLKLPGKLLSPFDARPQPKQ
jgi:hypothetical protein